MNKKRPESSEIMNINRLDHFAFTVADINVIAAFYQRVINFSNNRKTLIFGKNQCLQ